MNKPSRSYTVIVPTKTYLRKYLHAQYGNPIKLDYLTTLGNLVLCLLDNKTFTINVSEKYKEQRIQYMNDEVHFTAPISTMYWKGFTLSKDKIIAVNRFIENDFVRELSFYCKSNLKNRAWRPGIKEAIYSFCQEHQIEMDEDVTFDALQKSEFRYRKREEQRKEKKLHNILPKNVHQQNRPLQSILFPSFSSLHIYASAH
jgi:hypothetical protein